VVESVDTQRSGRCGLSALASSNLALGIEIMIKIMPGRLMAGRKVLILVV
jgi:hypothetical protein